MNGVEYLIGSETVSNQPMQPFSDEVLACLSEFSSELMRLPEARAFPDITSLAFWCRKANLEKLKAGYAECDTRLGRGLCFHVAPGNIPINFAFSWIFGLLSGNANVVRLSSKPFPQVTAVCSVLGKLIEHYPELASRTAFVRYPADNAITGAFSSMADARLIWGGDRTIEMLKTMPAKPRCVDVCFADRYSICLINAQKVAEADEATLTRLADNFYNDTWLMDQNACSSPQLILWLNDEPAARERFWQAAFSQAQRKYRLQAAVSVDKYTQMCQNAIDEKLISRFNTNGNLLYRAELSAIEPGIEHLRGHGGFFYEYALNDLAELVPLVTEKYQTITQFGLDPQMIQRFVIDQRLRGIDRIVPVGKAMDISIIWDGFDLIRVLSRVVNIER